MKLEQMNQAQLQEQQAKLQKEFDRYKEMGLSLNMARGKPSPAQLDLSAPLFDILSYDDYKAADGTDVRNYGVMDGLPEAKTDFCRFPGYGAGQYHHRRFGQPEPDVGCRHPGHAKGRSAGLYALVQTGFG